MFQLAAMPDYKSWYPDLGGTAQDGEIDDCLVVATLQIQGLTGRTYEYGSITETLSGRDAQGRFRDVIGLSLARAPIDRAVPVAVTENGVAVTTSFAYSTSAGCIVEPGPATLPPWQPKLRRQNCLPWSDGNANIVATWTGGFQAADIPRDLVKLCCFIANDIMQTPKRNQKTSRSSGAASASYTDEWPYWVQKILDVWTPR